jgi:hypothetical protein
MPPTAPHDTRFTVDGFMPFPNDGTRHEIIDGEHFVTPSWRRRRIATPRRESPASVRHPPRWSRPAHA